MRRGPSFLLLLLLQLLLLVVQEGDRAGRPRDVGRLAVEDHALFVVLRLLLAQGDLVFLRAEDVRPFEGEGL